MTGRKKPKLLGGERTVVALGERCDMARPSVSEHLKVLRDGGLVAEHKYGRRLTLSRPFGTLA